MKRTTLFFGVDAVAFVLFVLLAATGVLVRYVLPPGSGHFSTLWGMDRHEWGEVHFWMALILMGALATHLFFHWKWVVSMVKGRRPEGAGLRLGLATVGLAALIGLALSPFFGPIESTGEQPTRGARSAHDGDVAVGITIDGSMTLLDVERASGVPAAAILEGLGLPPDTPMDERLGRLRRAHGFEMEDVRAIVAAHQGQ